ncbi:MAG: polymer-forming cytoskeletal protein [Proteobacteria bacterium]|nr:polymer-forming cytoskeletal protein [Pseudomonadota bacterium]MBS0493733.1 polymer-forming cytoskeletal protein [Pseudomonadota bacterium]
MAVQNPFFGKRDNDAFQTRQPSSVLGGSSVSSTTTSHGPAVGTAVASKPASSSTTEGGGSKLTVGPNIKLKGVEITDCDTLVVEGTVEATMDSRVIQIAEQGAFHGTADIDIAEIHGEFDGQLTVREKLVIFSTGKVSGKIRYGKVVIEEGGQLSGEISVGVGSVRSTAASTTATSSSSSSTTASAASPALSAA